MSRNRSLFDLVGLGRRRRAQRNAARRQTRLCRFEQLENRRLLAVDSIQALEPTPIKGLTGEKPQSKVWEHAGDWWGVWSDNDATFVHRLDDDAWTPVLEISSKRYFRADVKSTDDEAHILLFHTATTPEFVSVEYNAAQHTYEPIIGAGSLITPWPYDEGVVETATIDIDSTHRMWMAYDTTSTIEVRYSDAPYTDWSDPIVIAPDVSDDDIAVVTALPSGEMGVLWSDQTTQRFGFRAHVDGSEAAFWSDNEVPAADSALEVGGGMADDHLNVAVSSDGSLYAAVKTSYDTPGYPAIGLLVRRPDGQWEPLHEVDSVGTRPIVQLNDATGELFVVYRGEDTSGPIVLRRGDAATLVFDDTRQTVLTHTSLNNPSGTKHNITDDFVVLASRGSVLESARVVLGPTSNQAPIVEAGESQSIVVSDSAVLDGTVSDDGLPDPPGAVSVLWSVASGPGEVAFADASSIDTTATFSATGTYVLRLTADDSELAAFDDVTVTVESAPTNQAPLVDAGPDQSVLESEEAVLDGTVSDDGLPDPPGAVSVLWSVVSGPGEVAFADVSSIDTTATFSSPGDYLLQLSASDGELSASDTLAVTVAAASEPIVATFQDGVHPEPDYNGTRDTRIQSDKPTKNYGSATYVTADGMPDNHAALVKWDVSGIRAGVAVQSAAITVNITGHSSNIYEIYELLTPWAEREATWERAAAGRPWEVAGARGEKDRGSEVLGTIVGTSKGLVTFELNEYGAQVVQSWINDPASNHGFIVQDYVNASDRIGFSSRETSDPDERPRLTVTYAAAEAETQDSSTSTTDASVTSSLSVDCALAEAAVVESDDGGSGSLETQPKVFDSTANEQTAANFVEPMRSLPRSTDSDGLHFTLPMEEALRDALEVELAEDLIADIARQWRLLEHHVRALT